MHARSRQDFPKHGAEGWIREGGGKLLAELVAHLRCCQNIQVGSSQTGPEPRAAIWFANYLPVGENCHLDTERDCHQRKSLGRDKRTAEAHLVKEAT